jgi:type IV pilus assembly protein PilX
MRKEHPMNTCSCCIDNERGVVIVAALLILVVLTIIGVAATNTSTMERQTSFNFMVHERAFYAAEAGMEHVKEALRNSLRQPARLALVATTGRADWTFILSGPPAATSTTYAGGLQWITNQPFDQCQYTITIWDNSDGDANPAADADGLIWVRSEAIGPRNARCSIETLLDANAITDPVTGYNAQEGSGSGKTYTSTDSQAVDFGTGFGQQVHING